MPTADYQEDKGHGRQNGPLVWVYVESLRVGVHHIYVGSLDYAKSHIYKGHKLFWMTFSRFFFGILNILLCIYFKSINGQFRQIIHATTTWVGFLYIVAFAKIIFEIKWKQIAAACRVAALFL